MNCLSEASESAVWSPYDTHDTKFAQGVSLGQTYYTSHEDSSHHKGNWGNQTFWSKQPLTYFCSDIVTSVS